MFVHAGKMTRIIAQSLYLFCKLIFTLFVSSVDIDKVIHDFALHPSPPPLGIDCCPPIPRVARWSFIEPIFCPRCPSVQNTNLNHAVLKEITGQREVLVLAAGTVQIWLDNLPYLHILVKNIINN
jgi:hypothetical protein